LDKTPVTIKPNQQDSQAELKKKEAKLLGQERAQKFTLRHKGWIYEIADWKAKYLTMKQSALLEDKEKPAEKKAETPAPAAGTTPAVTPAVPATPEPNQPKAAPQPATQTPPATTGTPATPQKAAVEPNQPVKAEKPADANALKGKP
jgi:hypothetical protein